MAARVAADLTKDERGVLGRGLREWGGPAAPTDEIARLIGFSDVRALHDDGRRIADAIYAGEPLAPDDWRRALLATELVFASDVVGSGVDWQSTAGISDEETIRLLRGVQRKLIRIYAHRA
jgi:hypothetical protein